MATAIFRCSTWRKNQAPFNVYDSSLSEFGVLGFEYGYSVSDPQTLTLWEAQFGDFSNGAQIIIDQFITTAEQKWSQVSGLVMLLPHGYEGQGPEHSSARMERFLRSAPKKISASRTAPRPPSTSIFCAVRCAAARKPLVLFTPKSLCCDPPVAVSSFSELTHGVFREVIGDISTRPACAKSSSAPAKFTTILSPPAKPGRLRMWRWSAWRNSIRSLTQRCRRCWPAIVRSGTHLVPGRAAQHGRVALAFGYFLNRTNRVIHYAGRLRMPALPRLGKRHAEEQKRLIEDALK